MFKNKISSCYDALLLRDVAKGPDGLIYIILNPADKNGAGAVYRLVPEPQASTQQMDSTREKNP